MIAPPRDLLEVKNALTAYDRIGTWNPYAERDLLDAHRVLMASFLDEPGRYRRGGVGIMAGDRLMHMAPPADRVPTLVADLLAWLGTTDAHPLVASTVFHYEFEFIHPFTDGNGRMGRLWQSVILHRWHPLFADLPVESLVHEHQAEYYLALEESNRQADSAPFLTFMLRMIADTVASVAPQVAPQVTPQVGARLAALPLDRRRPAMARRTRSRAAVTLETRETPARTSRYRFAVNTAPASLERTPSASTASVKPVCMSTAMTADDAVDFSAANTDTYCRSRSTRTRPRCP